MAGRKPKLTAIKELKGNPEKKWKIEDIIF